MRKRKESKGDEAEGLRWLTTYGDVVTLLLAFFVLLYAISQVDQQKFQLFVSGLEVPFGNPAGSRGLLSGDSGLADEAAGEGPLPAQSDIQDVDQGFGLIDGGVNRTEPTTTTVPVVAASSTTTTTTIVLPDEEILRTAQQMQALRDRVQDDLRRAGLDDHIDLRLDTRGLIIAVATDDVLFPSGSTQLSEEGLRIVEVLAPSLDSVGNTVLVEGHTDSVPLQRGGYDNWNLSTDRAVAVLHVLIDRYELEPARLVATGYGEYRPRADNDTAEGRALNRRIEIVIEAATE